MVTGSREKSLVWGSLLSLRPELWGNRGIGQRCHRGCDGCSWLRAGKRLCRLFINPPSWQRSISLFAPLWTGGPQRDSASSSIQQTHRDTRSTVLSHLSLHRPRGAGVIVATLQIRKLRFREFKQSSYHSWQVVGVELYIAFLEETLTFLRRIFSPCLKVRTLNACASFLSFSGEDIA